MSDIQSKVTRHAMKQKNTTMVRNKKPSTEINPELTQMSELAHKDMKTIIIIVFHMLKSYIKPWRIVLFF